MEELKRIKKKIKIRLKNGVNKYSGRTYYKNRKKPIVFVFGTGRSGSQSIISTLNNHSQIIGFHEQLRPLIRLSTELAGNPGNRKILKQIKKVWDFQIYPGKNGQLVVHSDQRFWNLIPFLKKYFPNSKYILFIREPVACIKSMNARNWFVDNEYPELNSHPWAKYRLSGPIAGKIAEPEWKKMTPIERAAWYWCYINWYVKNDFKELLNTKDYLILETEEMGDKLTEIQFFLKIPQEEFSLKITNRRRKKDNVRFEELRDMEIVEALRKMEELNPEFQNLHSKQ